MSRIASLALLFLVLFMQDAYAHTKSQSFSSWQVNGATVDAVFSVDARRVTQLSQLYEQTLTLDALLAAHLAETISVYQTDAPCPRSTLKVTGENSDTLRAFLVFICPKPIDESDGRIRLTSFQMVSATHLHIARVLTEQNDVGREFILNETSPGFSLKFSSAPRNIFGFIRLGFTHVLSGIDHVAFLAALVLVAGTVRRSLFCITGFTIGHSITLAVATLGSISPNEQMLEALIAFTIAITALEAASHENRSRVFGAFAGLTGIVILVPLGETFTILGFGICLIVFALAFGQITDDKSKALSPLLAVVFGLVHGAGFAGGLTELKLTPDQLIAPLFGFNLGVEFGQIGALAGIYAVHFGFGCISKRLQSQVQHWATLVLFGAGCFWFAERIWS